MEKYEKFITGETVNLVIPNKFAVNTTDWFSWFNNEKSTKYIPNHGLFPNTRENQMQTLEKMIKANKNKTGLYLLIQKKNSDHIIGIVSLSTIDWINRSAFLAIIMAPETNRDIVFNSLEAKALLTQHAFEKLNLNKVRTAQVIDLSDWQKYSYFFGYKVEGVMRAHYKKDNKYYDMCFHSCILEDFVKMKKIFGKNIWPGKAKFFKLMLNFPKENIYKKIKKIIDQENKKYENKIKKLIK